MFPRLFLIGLAVALCSKSGAQIPERQLDLAAEERQGFSTSPYSLSQPTTRSNLIFAGGLQDLKSGLVVIDVSNPAEPELIGECKAPGALQVSLSGDYAFVTGLEDGVHVMNVANPEAPALLTTFNTEASARRVRVSGSLLYVAGQSQLEILDISSPEAPVSISSLALNGSGDIAIAGQYGYATSLAGRIHVINLADPENPAFIKSVTHAGSSDGIEIANGVAFVAADSGGLLAFDLSDPENPAQIGQFRIDARNARSVRLRENLAYLSLESGGCRIVDVSDPTNMKLAGQLLYNEPAIGGGRTEGVAVSETHAFFQMTQQTTALKAVRVNESEFRQVGSVSSARTGGSLGATQSRILMMALNLLTVDVSTPEQPALVSTNTEIFGLAMSILVSGTRAVVVGSTGLHVLELDMEGDATPVGQTAINVPSRPAPPAVLVGNSVLLGGLYLQRADISDPTQPVAIGSVGAWGAVAYLTADGDVVGIVSERRPHLVDFSDPEAPVEIGQIETVNTAYAVAIAGDYLWVVNHTELLGFDMSNPAEPVQVSSTPIRNLPSRLVLDGTHLYVIQGINGVEIFDISEPSAPVRVGGNSAVPVNDLAVQNGYAFTVAEDVGLSTFRLLSEPELRLQEIRATGSNFEFAIEGAPGNSVTVERSTDLETWSDWQTIDLTEGTGFSDEAGGSRMFYRVKAVQP